jgi:hypothetical protein
MAVRAASLQRYVVRPAWTTSWVVAVQRGFASIGSTYRREGFGVRMAAEDSDDARKFFIRRSASIRLMLRKLCNA